MADALIGVADLGSNSFRLLIASVRHEAAGPQFSPVHESKESVQLAAGLSEELELSQAAQSRALAALADMREQIARHRPDRLRVVATNTFRVAANSQQFLGRARAALGHPIEVVSGLEEARLIYLGAAHVLGPRDERRLVIDIGGGSTEFIIGEDADPVEMMSTQVGCVGMTRRFFPRGRLSAVTWAEAVEHAGQAIERVARVLPPIGWQRAFGTSGTFKTMLRVLKIDAQRDALDRAGVDWLIERARAAGRAERLQLAGLRDDRRAIFFGGLAIVAAIYERLPLARLIYAPGAMREGVLLEIMREADTGRPAPERLSA